MSIITTGVRIGKAVYDEINIDSEIEALENAHKCLKEDLKDTTDRNKRVEIEEQIEFIESLLEDARDCKRNPGKKTMLSGLCCGAEWLGAAGMGYAGAQTGAIIGSVGGPVGSIAGAVTGSVIGAIVGSEMGQSAVNNFRCDEDGVATEINSSLVNIGKDAQLLNVDGNAYLGKGIEVGARGTLFQQEGMKVGNAGANFGITDKGVDVGIEAKGFWKEWETENSKIGVGLNLDTGIKADKDNMELSFLGFGFSSGKNGIHFKTPLFSISPNKK